MTERQEATLRCSFCTKHQKQVAKLVSNGKGCMVCNECAQVVLDMGEDEKDRRSPDD